MKKNTATMDADWFKCLFWAPTNSQEPVKMDAADNPILAWNLEYEAYHPLEAFNRAQNHF